MLTFVLRNLLRRPLRNILTLAGIGVASAVLLCIVAFGDGYRRSLENELAQSGVQLMLVPLGCPYDAAARVLQNNTLEHSLPAATLERAARDPDVAIAAPMLMASTSRAGGQRSDLWVGLDENALALKPWWRMRSGRRWFAGSNEVILGADAAALEMREPGDKFYSPELRRQFLVAGVLARSGTGDDNAIFLPLAETQRFFGQTNRLTAVAIRLRDPALLRSAVERLQQIPGTQVVTMTEMMGTFLNLLGAARTLVLALASIAIAVSGLTIFNTLLAAVIDRTRELATMRAIGASRAQVFAMLIAEALLLSGAGAMIGIGLAFALGPQIELAAKNWLPFSPGGRLLFISASGVLSCSLLALGVGVLAALYPAWRAARFPPALATKFE